MSVHGLMLHAGLHGAAPRPSVNSYERNAVNPERVQTILREACRCPKSSGPTLAKSEKKVLEVLQWWHLHLTVTVRCFLMQHMYDGGEHDGGISSGVPSSRTTWSLFGRAICKTAIVAIVGMSSRTWVKLLARFGPVLEIRHGGGLRMCPQHDKSYPGWFGPPSG